MPFGDLLKRLREEKGWSQAELAERTGLGQSSIARWELNQNEPPWSAVQRLAGALGVTTDRLADDPPADRKKGVAR